MLSCHSVLTGSESGVHTKCLVVLQAMHGEVKYLDDIISRVDDKVVKQNDNIRGLSDQARKDHRLGYTRRR